jgi:hypothetical protein
MHLALIPGHRPSAPGATAAGFSEYPVASILVEMILQRMPTDVPGLHVEKFVRPDTNSGLGALIKRVNASDVDGLLSLHFNATPKGMESPDRAYSCVYPGAKKARDVARVLEGIGFGAIPRIMPKKRDDLAILRDTTVPAVLDEPCYLDRRSHRKKLIKGLDTLAEQYKAKILRIYENRTLSDRKDRTVSGG